MNTQRNILLIAVVTFILLIAAYSNHFKNEFHFDDFHAINENTYIRDLKNIPKFFSDPKMFSADPEHWGIRAIVTTTLAIDYNLAGGLNPLYFQWDTFLWFIALCVLLYFMYKILLQKSFDVPWPPYLAIVSTAWFGLHKVNAETVNYIIARSDVLSTFFIILSFLIFIAWPQRRKNFYYIIPAIIGVFAKETVPVLVILLFFYLLLIEDELSVGDMLKAQNFKTVFGAFVKLIPVTVVVAATQTYTLSKALSIPGIANPFGYYVLTQTYVWLHYFISFFLPMNLSADTDWTVITNVYDERIIAGLVFVIALIVAISRTSARKETRLVAFGLIWFAASLLPTSLAPFAEVTNDHRMFFAFVGLSLSVVTYLGYFIKKHYAKFQANMLYRNGLWAAITTVLVLNAYGVYQRNKVWRTEESLWYDVTIKSPQNGRGLMNYAITQMAKGNYSVANTYFERATALLPYYTTLYINKGILNGALMRYQLADQNFTTAISLGPRQFSPYAYYAQYLNQVGRTPEAKLMAEKARSLNPNSTMVLQLLMNVYNKLGLWDNLYQAAQNTLTLLPGDKEATLYLNAAKARTPVIQAGTSPSVAAKPLLTPQDYLNQSLNYYNNGNYKKCIEACLNALRLKPDYTQAYNNIGAAYNQMQQWDKGAAACRKALSIDPNNKLAEGNLNWALSHMKK
jgi:tetratricopeptide (TPR) repeat protein